MRKPQAATRSASAKPVRKVAAGTLAAALTTIIVWMLQAIFAIKIPPEVAAALTTVVGFAIAYLTPPGSGETIE